MGGRDFKCGDLVHSETRYLCFLHLEPVVGVKYFPPKGTYVFMFFLWKNSSKTCFFWNPLVMASTATEYH